MGVSLRGAGGEIPALADRVSNAHALQRARGQSQAGGLTGAVASQTVTEVREGPLIPVGNRDGKCKGKRGLDCERDTAGRCESRS